MKKSVKQLVCIVLSMLLIIGVMPTLAAEIVNPEYNIAKISMDGKYLSAVDDSTERGAKLTANNTETQWLLRNNGTSYNLTNLTSGFNADINGAVKTPGREILQWTSNGGSNQLWNLEKIEGDKYYIVSPFSELYMTLGEDGSVTQEEKDESLNQAWTISIVGSQKSELAELVESESFVSLEEPYRDKLTTYFGSGGYISSKVRSKVETKLNDEDYFAADPNRQSEIIEDCAGLTYAWGEDRGFTKIIEHSYEVSYVGEEDGVWMWYDKPSEHVWVYNCKVTWGTGETHEFTYRSVDKDAEYPERVADGLGYIPYPIARQLTDFFYTDDDSLTWNGGGGQVWNNSHTKGSEVEAAETFSHELGHVMDNSTMCEDSFWTRAMAEDGIPVSEYGQTSRWEDLADFSTMYLLAEGDDERMAEIKLLYPARFDAYRALLYYTDNTYYAEFKPEYDALMAEIADRERLDIGSYYTISFGDKALVHQYNVTDNGGLYLEAPAKAENQSWQPVLAGENIYYTSEDDDYYSTGENTYYFKNRSTGAYLYAPSMTVQEPLCASFEEKTAFMLSDGELLSADSGLELALSSDGKSVVQTMNEADSPVLTAGEGVEGIAYYKIEGDGGLLTLTDSGLAIEKDNGSASQIWLVSTNDNGSVRIFSSQSNVCLDVSGGSLDEGGKVITYSPTDGENQSWIVTENENGSCTIAAKHSGLYLTKGESGLIQSTVATEWRLVEAEAQ